MKLCWIHLSTVTYGVHKVALISYCLERAVKNSSFNFYLTILFFIFSFICTVTLIIQELASTEVKELI